MMIISEKQILGLMIHCRSYIELLKVIETTESGESNLNSCIALLNSIQTQQSEELKVIE